MYFGIYVALFLLLLGSAVTNDDNLLQALEHELQELKELVGDLALKLESTEKINGQLSEQLVNAEETLDDLITENKAERRAFTESQVVFYAKLANTMTSLTPHQTIIFDTIVTQTFEVYNTSTGIFTVPVTGMYVLSWTANVEDQSFQSTELVIDGSIKASAYAGTASTAGGDYGSTSQTVVAQVNRGQHVWIRTGTRGKGSVHGSDFSTFSCFLLFPTR